MTYLMKHDFVILGELWGGCISASSGVILNLLKYLKGFVNAFLQIVMNNLVLTKPSCPKHHAVKLTTDFRRFLCVSYRS
jgi:hypothetical protein